MFQSWSNLNEFISNKLGETKADQFLNNKLIETSYLKIAAEPIKAKVVTTEPQPDTQEDLEKLQKEAEV